MLLKLKPNMWKKRVDRCFIYSDIVSSKIRFGDHMTNLLDIISLNPSGGGSGGGGGGRHIRYKPLRHSKMSQISLTVNDIDGNPIHFPDEEYTVFELNIRPVSL